MYDTGMIQPMGDWLVRITDDGEASPLASLRRCRPSIGQLLRVVHPLAGVCDVSVAISYGDMESRPSIGHRRPMLSVHWTSLSAWHVGVGGEANTRSVSS